jgi:non-ribosomal peptide synthase protein (TIGR01720 family)
LSHREEIASRLREQPTPQVTFNYLGKLGAPLPGLPVRPASESPGPAQDPNQLRHNEVMIQASITRGNLRVTWNYSAHLHRERTIQELAREFERQLGAL